MRLLRLKGRKTCDRLLRHGKGWKGRSMNVRWMQGHPNHPSAVRSQSALYVGTIASTKLDKSAVKRNRMRRRCREAMRLTAATMEIPVVLQLLIAPKSSSLSCPFEELAADARAFLTSHLHASGSQKIRQ